MMEISVFNFQSLKAKRRTFFLRYFAQTSVIFKAFFFFFSSKNKVKSLSNAAAASRSFVVGLWRSGSVYFTCTLIPIASRETCALSPLWKKRMRPGGGASGDGLSWLTQRRDVHIQQDAWHLRQPIRAPRRNDVLNADSEKTTALSWFRYWTCYLKIKKKNKLTKSAEMTTVNVTQNRTNRVCLNG